MTTKEVAGSYVHNVPSSSRCGRSPVATTVRRNLQLSKADKSGVVFCDPEVVTTGDCGLDDAFEDDDPAPAPPAAPAPLLFAGLALFGVPVEDPRRLVLGAGVFLPPPPPAAPGTAVFDLELLI